MATIIQRSSADGDPRLTRDPFPEPGTQPLDRLSALAFQGGNGDIATNVANAEYGRSNLVPGQGSPPPYVVLPSGVPVFDFDSGTLPDGNNPALYITSTGRPIIKTQIVIGRVIRLGTTPSGNAQHSYGHMTRTATSGLGGLYIGNTGGVNPGQLCAVGTSVSNSIFGPEVEVGPNSGLHFFAAAWNGSGSFVQYDNAIVNGSLDMHTGPQNFLIGFTQSGLRFQAVEVAQYDVALTKAQVEAKRAHYRALYQF